jgi:Ca2+-binding RTX toxin-like protein
MKIKGTGKSEVLVGTSGTDLIDGGAGNDTIIGGVGADTLTGGRGADTFVFGARSQLDVITDFNPAEGDTVLFDLDGSGAEAAFTGRLSDGMSFQVGTGTCTVTCVDLNGDGVTDTQLTLNGESVFLLGWSPDQLYGSCLIFG